MVWSWGGVTLAFDEEPIDGNINFVRRREWAFANPRGQQGRLKQKLYTDALDGRVKLLLTETTKDALQAVFEADEATLHINPRPPFDVGVMMLITKFTAVWNPTVPGDDVTQEGVWFECDLEMVED